MIHFRHCSSLLNNQPSFHSLLHHLFNHIPPKSSHQIFRNTPSSLSLSSYFSVVNTKVSLAQRLIILYRLSPPFYSLSPSILISPLLANSTFDQEPGSVHFHGSDIPRFVISSTVPQDHTPLSANTPHCKHPSSAPFSAKSSKNAAFLTFAPSRSKTPILPKYPSQQVSSHIHLHTIHQVTMQFSTVKVMLALFSLLTLFALSTATPLPADAALESPSSVARQESNGIYYGNLCNPNDVYGLHFPNKCWLTLYQKKDWDTFTQSGPSTHFYWDTTLYLFRTNCDIIGYIPDVGDLEGIWVSMDSQLRYTVEVTTTNQIPHFNYAGMHYLGNSPGTYSVNWTEDDSGIDVTVWKLLFSC